MVAAPKSRITAMIGSDDQDIVPFEGLRYLPQHAIHLRDRIVIALRIPPMAKHHVGIHQIHEKEAALFRILLGETLQAVEASRISFAGIIFGQSAVIKNVANLPHTHRTNTHVVEARKQAALRHCHGKVLAPGSPAKISGNTFKRTRDDTPGGDSLSVTVGPHPLAIRIQTLNRNNRFVGGDLNHGIGGRIKNGPILPNMLLPQRSNNFCAGGCVITQNTRAELPAKGVDQVTGKGRAFRRKDGQRLLQHNSRQFPVASHRILARRSPHHQPESGPRTIHQRHTGQRITTQSGGISKAPIPQRRPDRPPLRTTASRAPRCVGTHIPVLFGVCGGTHPKAVDHHNNDHSQS